MNGNELFSQLVSSTGLPIDIIAPRLEAWLISKGLSPDQMTLEQFRGFLADMLQDLILQE